MSLYTVHISTVAASNSIIRISSNLSYASRGCWMGKIITKYGLFEMIVYATSKWTSSNETIPIFGISGMNRKLPFDSVVFCIMAFNLTIFQPLTK
jgi:ABC-type iron transport system FetAB permease component